MCVPDEKGPGDYLPPTHHPTPHSAPSVTLAWDQFPNSSLSRCLMISERERVTGHVRQLSAEPP